VWVFSLYKFHSMQKHVKRTQHESTFPRDPPAQKGSPKQWRPLRGGPLGSDGGDFLTCTNIFFKFFACVNFLKYNTNFFSNISGVQIFFFLFPLHNVHFCFPPPPITLLMSAPKQLWHHRGLLGKFAPGPMQPLGSPEWCRSTMNGVEAWGMCKTSTKTYYFWINTFTANIKWWKTSFGHYAHSWGNHCDVTYKGWIHRQPKNMCRTWSTCSNCQF
jgi:hypothetical protein